MTSSPEQSDLAFNMADRLFGTYVDDVEGGKVIDVRVEWVPVDSDGETIFRSEVYIDDEPAREVYLRTAVWTEPGASLSDEALSEGAEEFNDMMAEFDVSVQYQRDIRKLDAEIGFLAISADAGYSRAVKEYCEEAGLSTIGDGEIIAMARLFVVQDIQVLGGADEAGEDYEQCYREYYDLIQDLFDTTPGAYWVMVGATTGEIKDSGPQGTVPTRESHIGMELDSGEIFFVYLRPKSSQ